MLKQKQYSIIINLMKKLITLSILTLFLFFFPSFVFSDTYIIVIDTSLSMNRKVIDNTRIYEIALKSLSNSIFSLKKGDIVYILDFNETVNIRPPIKITSDETKEVIYKIMSGTQPYGKWTFTYKMLEEVANLIKRENLSPKTTKVIIISDGIDDPPIKSKKYFVELEKLSSLFDPQQLIYYIYLEKLIQTKSEPKNQTELSKKLKQIPQVSLIEVKTTNEVKEAIEKGFKGERSFKITQEIIFLSSSIGVLIIVIILILLRKRTIISLAKQISNISRLECYSVKHRYTIPLKGKTVITSGKGKNALIGWNYSGKLIIKPTSQGFKVFLTKPTTTTIKTGSILKKGDSFTIGNYTFEAE